MKNNITTAHIIAIGDEILYGQTLNTNTHWLSQQLNNEGILVQQHTTISDKKEAIFHALEHNTADIVILMGGLGPTGDDITKETLAAYFETPLIFNQKVFDELCLYFKKRGFQMTETNKKQAELPENCLILPNPNGTAAGMCFEKEQQLFVSLPGVPYEMKYLITHEVLPLVKKRNSVQKVFHSIVKVIGIGESWLSDKIQDWEMGLPPHIKLAYLPTYGEIKLRLTAKGDDTFQLEKHINAEKEKLMPIIENYIFGFNEDTLISVIADLCKKKNWHIAVAESCTGGNVAHSIVQYSGASAFFKGGVIAYDNELKVNFCDVKKEDLRKWGAVSQPVVCQMAKGVAQQNNTQIGIATSGIAGPEGGTNEKPVGTIHIAVCILDKKHPKIELQERIYHQQLNLGQQRDPNIKRTTTTLFELLWRVLVGKIKE